MTLKRIISLILSLMMLSGALIVLSACSSDKEDGGSETDSITDDIVSDEGIPENEKLGFDDSAIDYNGAEITILQREHHKTELAGNQDGDVLDLNTYTRNLYIQQKLGVEFNFVEEVCVMGTDSNTKDFYTRIDVSATTGLAELDAVAYPAVTFVNDAAMGYFVDLKAVPNIDLSKAWYNQSYMSSAEIEGKSFGSVGDVTMSAIDHLEVIFMNIDLAEVYYSDVDFYKLVADGEWTYDTMLTLLKRTGDLGNDGEGIATMALAYNANSIDGFMRSLGIDIVSRDNTGTPYVSLNSQKNADLADRLKELYHNTPGVYRVGSNPANWDFLYGKSFAAGKAIFEVFRLNTTEEYYLNSEVKYGILPMPMLDNMQDGYRSTPQAEYSCMGIFDCISDERKEIVGTALEYMGHYSYNKLRPILYETLYKNRYLSDVDSGEVFDLIIDSITFDFGYIYSQNMGEPINAFREYIWNGTGDLGSNMTTKSELASEKLEELLVNFKQK